MNRSPEGTESASEAQVRQSSDPASAPNPRHSPDQVQVACVAMHSRMAEPAANQTRVAHWAERAHAAGATFVLFTEECITGSLNKSDLNQTEAAQVVYEAEQITRPFLADLAARLQVTLAVGTIEPAGEKFANNLLIVGPVGHLATYTKAAFAQSR